MSQNRLVLAKNPSWGRCELTEIENVRKNFIKAKCKSGKPSEESCTVRQKLNKQRNNGIVVFFIVPTGDRTKGPEQNFPLPTKPREK